MPRGRRPSPEPSISTNVSLSETLRTRIDLHLFSTVEGRVPKGAYQRFFTQLALDFFNRQALDLSPHAASLPGEHIVYGNPLAVQTLERILKERR